MVYQVHKIITHPGYKPTYKGNNIAIIRLKTEAIINSYVTPICLWDANKLSLSEVVGKRGIVVGFGRIQTGELANYLQRANLSVITNERCGQSSEQFFEQLKSGPFFCAGYQNGEKFVFVFLKSLSYHVNVYLKQAKN